MSIVIWIICGVIAGWLTGLIMKGNGFGLIGDLIIGILGGLIGGYLSGLLGIHLGSGWIGDIITAVLGGIVLVAVVRLLRRV